MDLSLYIYYIFIYIHILSISNVSNPVALSHKAHLSRESHALTHANSKSLVTSPAPSHISVVRRWAHDTLVLSLTHWD